MSSTIDHSDSWVAGSSGSLWDIDNLPYGVFSIGDGAARVGVRIGDRVLDLSAARPRGADPAAFAQSSLNSFLASGPVAWSRVRADLQHLLTDGDARVRLEPALHSVDDVDLQMPFDVADFVDFYSSEHHASNVGRIFRPDVEPLYPNWQHLPVGYQGRSGSVVESGTPVRRPSGQIARDGAAPRFGPTEELDIEAELGFVVGVPSLPGHPVSTAQFRSHVFGAVGLNDWSARDIQRWEYVPLGPFLGKSFATTISAWVTPLQALEVARVPLPARHVAPLDYLEGEEPAGFDIDIEVVINGQVLSRPVYRTQYWSPAQMLAHITVNGARVRTGDLYGTGTISGPVADQRGSLLELAWGGTQPWNQGGRPRTYLEDGDHVVLRYTAPGERGPISLGDVAATILGPTP